MKKYFLPALWIVTIGASCFATSFIQKKARLAAIADAKNRIANGNFTESDLIILYVDHGKGEEQITLFEAMRDQDELRKMRLNNKKQLEVIGSMKTLIGTQNDLIAGYQVSVQAAENAYQAAKKSAELYKEELDEKSQVEMVSPPNYSTAVPRGASYSPPITKANEIETTLPNWQMPTRNQALAIIKKNADAEWGTDFRMVEHEIENQTKAYDKLVHYQKQNWKPLMRTLLNKAAKQWGEDYRMMVYEIEKQIDAKDRLDAAR